LEGENALQVFAFEEHFEPNGSKVAHGIGGVSLDVIDAEVRMLDVILHSRGMEGKRCESEKVGRCEVESLVIRTVRKQKTLSIKLRSRKVEMRMIDARLPLPRVGAINNDRRDHNQKARRRIAASTAKFVI